MKNDSRFIELLTDDRVIDDIYYVYHKLHTRLYNDQNTTPYVIMMDLQGNITYGNTKNNENTLVIYTMETLIDITEDDMGDIKEVRDYNAFVNWAKENNTTPIWAEYYEFNPKNYVKIEQEAWEFKCYLNDYYYIKSRIYDLLVKLQCAG